MRRSNTYQCVGIWRSAFHMSIEELLKAPRCVVEAEVGSRSAASRRSRSSHAADRHGHIEAVGSDVRQPICSTTICILRMGYMRLGSRPACCCKVNLPKILCAHLVAWSFSPEGGTFGASSLLPIFSKDWMEDVVVQLVSGSLSEFSRCYVSGHQILCQD